MVPMVRKHAVMLCLLALCAIPAWPQESRATLLGIVADASGAVLPESD